MGVSGSASFQRVRKSLYAASARTRAASASAPCEVLDCKALARATPRCANAPVQQFQMMPLWSIIFGHCDLVVTGSSGEPKDFQLARIPSFRAVPTRLRG